MTKWYSPNDKLPKLKNLDGHLDPCSWEGSSEWVYCAFIDKYKVPIYLECYYCYNKKVWLIHDSLLMPAPSYWCYLPKISQEKINNITKD